MASLFKSKRFWFAILLIIGIFSLKLNPIPITLLILIAAIVFNKNTVRPLNNYKFWIVIFVLILIVPLFTGIQDSSFLGISYSTEQLQKTLLMTLRGISVFLLFQVLTIDLNVNTIKPLFSKIGIKNFNLLYNLSNEIFPKIKSILNARYSLFKSHWKKHKSIEVFLIFLTDIFSDFFHLSDSLIVGKPQSNSITVNDFLKIYDFSKPPYLIVVVGDAGSGKTPWIEELIESLQSDGQYIDGLISKKQQVSDDKWYHDLIRISTKERHQLTTMDEIETDVKVGKFHFYDDTIKWGNEQLKSISNTEWIIIDEIGLLEFDGGGFIDGLQSISVDFKGNLVITIRSALLKHFDAFIQEYLLSVKEWKKHIIKL